MELSNAKILLGVSGGIAVFKAASLTSSLRKQGAQVQVVMTRHAEEFVTPLTFATLSGRPVHTDTFGSRGRLQNGGASWDIDHLSLSDFADICLVAPATANIIGKTASAVCDDLLSTTLIALTCPIIFAPAMNTRMWLAPPTQDNIARLKTWSVNVIGPAEGRLACNTTGPGRMSEPEEILAAATQILRDGKTGQAT